MLKLTFFIRRAVFAVYIVNREEKTKSTALQAPYGRGVGFDDHAVRHRDRTCGDRMLNSRHFHKTQSAGRRRVRQIFHETEVGDVNTIFQAGLKNRVILFYRQLPAIHQNSNCHDKVLHKFGAILDFRFWNFELRNSV